MRALFLWTAALALLCAVPPACCQTTAGGEVLSLDAAIRQALEKRPLLNAGEERIAATQARITQAKAGLMPRVDIQGSATDGPLGAPALGLGGLVGTPIKKHTGASINLVQTLLDFGRTRNTVRARQAEVTVSQESLAADRNRVVLEVRRAYLQALLARRLLEVNKQILEQRRLVAVQAAALQQNGLASRVDVDLAEVNVSQARLALVRSQNDIETAYADLGAAVGNPVGSEVPLSEVLPDPAKPAPAPAIPLPSDAVREALQSRPELKQAAAQVKVYEHLTSAAKAGKRPFLSGVASAGKVNPVPLFEPSDKPWAVGLALTIPVFTGGLVDGQVREGRHNAGAARSMAEETANDIRRQVTAALANLVASEEAIRVTQAQLTTATDALSLATQRYQAQFGSIVELTQAQVVFATAQNDLVRAQYDRELALAALDFAVGRAPAQVKTEVKP